MIDQSKIRNFCIIAHIDHGKSTLADRLLEVTHTIPEREMTEQVLDKMDLERERGITIKSQAVRIVYDYKDGQKYLLNLIDTPGHVDFTYEVSRSLRACEGALLVVDAAQGVEAQTLANAYLALENDLVTIPLVNKIDLPNADIDRVRDEIEKDIGISAEEALLVSAKTGQGIEAVLEAIVEKIPPPTGDSTAPLKVLIFDSYYESYRGVIVFIRIIDGILRKGMKIKFMQTGRVSDVEEIGVLSPGMVAMEELDAGQVGYLICGVKNIQEIKVGDTVTEKSRPAFEPCPQYREIKPMVFSGLYPLEGGEYEELREALERLKLNDPSFVFEPETSKALGFGFRCGFLGLLHMDIIKERLEREYSLELLTTAPSVAFEVLKTNGDTIYVRNPHDMPQVTEISSLREPCVASTVLVPSEYIGAVMDLCQERRGAFKDMVYLSQNRVQIRYELPLGEILFDFFDQLKSRTRGYASLDYEPSGYQESDLVKLDVMISYETVDALSLIVHRGSAYQRGKDLVDKLRAIIPKQQFEVAIQAAIGGRIIARETIKARRKDVTAKCYGGDITRKRKLLQRQKEGKRRMKQIGNVEIPQEAFMAILQVGEKEKK